MNWLEIDKILYGIIARHDAVEDMLKEAKTQFKWNDSQANAALLPLLKHNTTAKVSSKSAKTRSRKTANKSKASK